MKLNGKPLAGSFILGGFVALLSLLHAQENQSNQALTDLEVMLQALEATTPTPAESLPFSGTFWSAQHAPGSAMAWPPLPGNILGLAAWSLGNGVYLLNDTNVDYDELRAEREAAAALAAASAPRMRTSMMASSLSSSYAYSNPVYLTNMAAIPSGSGNVTASLSITGGTNFVPYDILMSTNLAASVSDWTWLGIGYTSNNYAFYGQPADQAFYILAKPSKTMTVGFGDDVVSESDPPFALTNALRVVGGGGHSLALKNDGTVVAWGINNYGQATVPTNLVGIAMIAAGGAFSVALQTNSTIRAWGWNVFGECNVPSYLTNATVISAQSQHTLALRSDGTVVSWGYNSAWGETNVPAGLSNVVAISAGYGHNLAVSNGFVVAWGYNGYHQCDVPAGLSNVVDVAAGLYHSLALLNNGTVVAWGDNAHGATNVPAGLTNVVAIVASGDYYPGEQSAYSLALKSDGTVVAWGDGKVLNPVSGLSNVIAIGAGVDFALAVRTGPATPVITLEPVNEYQILGGNVTFTARGTGLYGVTYQWQTNNVNLSGATNAALTLTNVQAAQLVPYDVVVSDHAGMGSIVSSNANLYLVTSPIINSQTLPTNQFVLYQSNLTLNVSASAPGQFNGFPLSYQWRFNGINISGATASQYTFTATNSGTYSIIVSNAAGNVTVIWQVTVLYPGNTWAWGDNQYGESTAPLEITNISAIAAGGYQSVAVLDNGSAIQWGDYWSGGTNFTPVGSPPTNANLVAVAAGITHSIALMSDGTVIQWGLSGTIATNNFPTNLFGVKAISAGWYRNLALLTNGSIVDWGYFAPIFGLDQRVPSDLTNATAIACGAYHNLAVRTDGTVASWGYNDSGQTNVPTGLSNVVAVAGGGRHSLALKADGTLKAWGDNTYGQCNVPVGLSNVMAIAAGDFHTVALKNDGSVVSWGDNTYGETNVPGALASTKLIAAGGYHTLATMFSPLVSYPVDVTKDVLLIYNSNSTNSVALKDYYLAHRPMITGANVLGVACDVGELTTSTNYDSQIAAPVFNWLSSNPTKHPEYIILFFDIPTRLSSYPSGYGSVSYNLHNSISGIPPFVNHINANNLADCEAYVDKVAYMGTNYSPGKLIISASVTGYANTNYVLDDVKNIYCGDNTVANATNGLAAAGVSSLAISYLNGCETTNNLPHITSSTNVAGYISWGSHSSLGGNYAINPAIRWSGNSGWWIIETVESFNGIRGGFGQGNFTQWFSSNAFGGTNYSNTPIGAAGHTEEPGLSGVENSAIYFGLWASEKNFAICSWNSRNTPYFQAIGDPLVTK